MRRSLWALPVVLAAFIAACAGGANGAATGTRGPAATSTPVPEGTPFTAATAPALLDAVVLKPADLPRPALGWKLASDTSQDNAAANTEPTAAAANSRCGRLLARTTTAQPADVTGRYIAGETVSFFSAVTVYATSRGAADCAAQAAAAYQRDPSTLIKAFGSLFMDPAAVKVTAANFPTIGDGSAAFNLAGKVQTGGFTVDITLLVVAFRLGAVSAVVGSAASVAPSADELVPLVGVVLRRIATAEGR